MKRYKANIISSVIAGILICAMLAACGAAENKQLDNLSDSQTDGVSDIQNVDNETVEPDVTEPEDYIPEADIPEIDIVLPANDPEPDVQTEPSEPEAPAEPEENNVPDVLNADIANIIIETASAQLGVPYTSGGSSPETGFDSSGFVYYCVRSAGIDFPRQVSSQLKAGEMISYDDLKPGDVAYFSAEPGESASFCGIYVGGGLIIYSPVPGDNVKTANITTGYWTQRFVCGIRPSIN